jgi:2-polyprenyl-3-methyl-5-hydroxy-6-metoxy-1,4-benzoquinol methylase
MTATPTAEIAAQLPVCSICGGQLELARQGSASGHEPSSFSPSCHRTGEHGDFYRCRRCGTLHQPSLPRGSALYDIYRAVSDERYMVEERGRRRTARRLLDRLGKYVPEGRLLQVGCGYGLLLDEARRRGYAVEGVEPSIEAAGYAREQLGLPVRPLALEEADLRGERYDAILLVDVLEHLGDPRAALDRLPELLVPAGVLVIVTPDPSSLTARLAGANWWCYVPAHSCLIPRETLRQLLVVRDLDIVEDVASVHSFTPGYWLAGVGDRGGWVGRAITQVAARLPRSLLLTASLRDERVLLARNLQTTGQHARRWQPGNCA